MGGRPGKPIELHVLQGNPGHFSRAEIGRRRAGEIRLGTKGKFKMPGHLRGDKVASRKWRELVALFVETDASFVTSADVEVMARYCATCSEYENLRQLRAQIVAGADSEDLATVEGQLNKKNEIILRLEGVLFLTPLARVRNVIRKAAPPAEDPLKRAGFGNV